MGSLAATAKLLASLDLDASKFKAGANSAMGSLGKLEGRFGKLGSIAQRGLSNAVTNIKRLALVGVGIIAANVTAGIKSLASIESAQTATTQVLKSTAGAAGQSFDEITKRSQKWSDAIGVNEEDVQHLQNVLLTFTKISGKQFDQATTSVLDMSTALGEDMQQAAIQVGKALNDPVKGATALRRVGVSLTDDQVKQIKKLVAAGKTEAAQQLILNELQTEFGGQAEKSGQTAEGQFKRFGQAVQAAQRALATAFLPVMLEVGNTLRTWLADPATLRGIKDFGTKAAGAFKSLLESAKRIPWKAIGTAASGLVDAGKALLDAFLGMPAWVQTAVVTGWGLNKLTGGALSGIVGELGKGLIKGVLGMNAGVVNAKAGVVNVAGGGGVGGAAGAAGGGGLLGIGKTLLRGAGLIGGAALLSQASGTNQQGIAGNVAGGALVGASVAGPLGAVAGAGLGGVKSAIEHESAQNSKISEGIKASLDAGIGVKTPAELQTALDAVNQGIADIKSNPLNVLVQGSALDNLQAMRDQLVTKQQEQTVQSHAASERTDQYLSDLSKKQDKLGAQVEKATKSGNEARAAKLQSKMKVVSDELDRFKEKQGALTNQAKIANTNSLLQTRTQLKLAQVDAADRIVTAIKANRSTTRVTITAADVTKATNTRKRSGPSSGSAGGSSLGSGPGGRVANP